METTETATGNQVIVARRHSSNRKTKHLAKFQRRGMFAEATSEARYRRASSVEDLEAAFRLVHDVFVEKKFILPCPSGMRMRVFEATPDLATFVAKIDGEVVGTIGLVVDSPDMGLPSDRVFGAELNELRSRGKAVCEVTNLAIRPNYRRGPMCSELMRCVMAQAWESNCSHMTCSVSPQQKDFYEFIGFYQNGSERSYSDEVDDPVVSMCWDLGRLRQLWNSGRSIKDPFGAFWKEFCLDRNPYLQVIDQWNAQARETFSNVFELSRLFGKCVGFFEGCTPEQLKLVRSRLGDGIDLDQLAAGRIARRLEPDQKFHPDGTLRIARHSYLRNKSRCGVWNRGTLIPASDPARGAPESFVGHASLFCASEDGRRNIENNRVLRE